MGARCVWCVCTGGGGSKTFFFQNKKVYNGVPQGSVLGPLLFLLFINDVSNCTADGCVLNMYADDVINYISAATSDDIYIYIYLYINCQHIAVISL